MLFSSSIHFITSLSHGRVNISPQSSFLRKNKPILSTHLEISYHTCCYLQGFFQVIFIFLQVCFSKNIHKVCINLYQSRTIYILNILLLLRHPRMFPFIFARISHFWVRLQHPDPVLQYCCLVSLSQFSNSASLNT